MRRFTTRAILAIALAMVGCTASTTDKAPGGEDALPLDGKADSFRAPTEHGALRMGESPSRAELSEEEKFHAWTFELSGDAEVALQIGASNENLDTVMYLYRRESPDDSWGSYISKNDDANDDTLFSAIEKSLGEGEYRVIVKGYKARHRGPFSLSAECSGRGCESRGPGPAIEVPAATEFTESCVNALWESLGAPTVYGDSFGIHPEATEGHEREVLVANAHYADLSDWQEYVYDDEDRAEFTFDVSFVRTTAGSVVTMADGGDESTTEYAFDSDGNLLAYYVHNQSPWTEFYCGQEGDEPADYPDEDCVSAWINGGPHDEGSLVRGTETYSPELPNDEIDALMSAAISVYVENELDGADGEISIEYEAWEGDGGRGGEYLLSADGAVMVSYAVVERWDEPVVVFQSSENAEGPEMICAD